MGFRKPRVHTLIVKGPFKGDIPRGLKKRETDVG